MNATICLMFKEYKIKQALQNVQSTIADFVKRTIIDVCFIKYGWTYVVQINVLNQVLLSCFNLFFPLLWRWFFMLLFSCLCFFWLLLLLSCSFIPLFARLSFALLFLFFMKYALLCYQFVFCQFILLSFGTQINNDSKFLTPFYAGLVLRLLSRNSVSQHPKFQSHHLL